MAAPETLRARLDALVDESLRAPRLDHDPLGLVHAYRDAADREVAGLVAALLAFGNVTVIRRAVARVLGVLGDAPARAVDESSEASFRRLLRGFRHRVYAGPDVARLLANAGALRRRHGSLGAFYAAAHEEVGPGEALARLADALRGPEPSRGMAHLVPDPRKGSAVKRLHLYLRWMVRPRDGVDLGLWNLPPSTLVMPLDTHIHRISRNLGLTDRADASARTAAEITGNLRRLRPHDPVAYDFALCHLGVSRACPSRRDEAICGGCSLRDVCVTYAAGTGQKRRKGSTTVSSRRSASRPSKAGPRSI